MKYSALVLTFNEESNIGRCLESLGDASDIVVLDSGSQDQTVNIAESMGARIMKRPFDDFASQRNHGLEYGAFADEWVVHLDADEELPEQFRAAIAAFEPTEDIYGYQVPSKTILDGKWLRYAGMYPTYQVRLGHRDRLRFVQVGHGQREAVPPQRIGMFDHPYDHHSFSHGMAPWLEKHVRYARDEAVAIDERHDAGGNDGAEQKPKSRTARRRAMKNLANRIPASFRPIARFIYVYIFRRGFLDGFAGFRYAFMLSVYEGMIAVIRHEKIAQKTNNLGK